MRSLRALLLAALLCAAWSLPARAAESAAAGGVAVIYPQVREPYRSVFLEIARGVESVLDGKAKSYEVDPQLSAETLSEQLRGEERNRLILLGKHGLALSAGLDPGLRRVVGAVLTSPDSVPSGVLATSLAPSPERLFATLRDLAPRVRRIHVIYGADRNEWLIELGRGVAEGMAYEYSAVRKDDIREGANAYRELLRGCGPEDAVWLLQAGAFIDESSVLQMILRTAWDRNVVVFSSNGSHVPKGALFALFPDNTALGAHLARVADESSPAQTGLQPLEQLNLAINIRTADHLGLGLDARDGRFRMVFPNR